MKNLPLIFLFLLIGFIAQSCEKKDIKTQQPTFETALLQKMALFKNEDDGLIAFKEKKGNYFIDFAEHSLAFLTGQKEGARLMAPQDYVCSGGGIAFAKCCKNYLDDGSTLTIWKSGDTYYAKIAQK